MEDWGKEDFVVRQFLGLLISPDIKAARGVEGNFRLSASGQKASVGSVNTLHLLILYSPSLI
jgi:hypothetical protein